MMWTTTGWSPTPRVDVAGRLVDISSRSHDFARLQKLPPAGEVESMHLAEVAVLRDDDSWLEAEEQSPAAVARQEAKRLEGFSRP